MRRVEQLEILDQLGSTVSTADLAENLADLARINRLLGTRRTICNAVWALIDSADLDRALNKPIRVLDVGAGTGDILKLLDAQAERRGIAIQSIALEYDPAVLNCLRQAAPNQPAMGGDALALPIAEGGVDIVICAQMLHHLTPDQVRAALIEYRRVAKYGIVLFDLDRSRPAQIGAWLLTRLLSRNRLTRHDGLLSVGRAYCRSEMMAIVRSIDAATPAEDWRFQRIFPFRWLALYIV